MGLTERHWFEDEEPELTENQLEDILWENNKIFERGYQKGFSDGKSAILREQEPRVMTLEEVKTAEVVFLEFQDVITARIVDTWFGNSDGDIRLVGMDGTLYMAKAAYNDSWRCWTFRPTDEQREATPWAG